MTHKHTKENIMLIDNTLGFTKHTNTVATKKYTLIPPYQNRNNNNKSNRKFSAATFRGFGCTAGASQKVSVPVPAVIRSSADREGKSSRKKKHRRNSNSGNSTSDDDDDDVWCGPGIGFSTDAAAASVECVVARKNVSARGKLDVVEDRVTHREVLYFSGFFTIQ